MSISGVDEPDPVGDPAQPQGTQYDVFLSYNRDDRLIVRDLAGKLRESGVRVWFDADSLTPGCNWEKELSASLVDSRACAVCVGPRGFGNWAELEMQAAFDRAARDNEFQVFAVLLPGVGFFDASTLPPFLALKQWVDLREGLESDAAMQNLMNAIDRVAFLAPASGRDADGECPYRGLEAFEEEHAPYFFGRAAQVQRLLEALRQSRFCAVIGQSGVGKSSLVRAGLLPRLRSGALPGSASWRIVIARPGAHPTGSLASLVALHGQEMRDMADRLVSDERSLDQVATLAVANEPTGSKLLVLIDQFEEIFTLCTNAVERVAFVRNIVYAATIPHGSTVVVVTMRADFYPLIARFPEFAQLVQSRQMLVSRPTDDELREIIQQPAYRVGLSVEQGLTETILADFGREPGNLPLLQHALLELWRNRRGTMLTLDGYRSTGGVQKVLGERAEAVYQDLPNIVKVETKSVFLRLIQPGEGTADTRRRIPVTELTTDAESAITEAIRRFVDARLLTTSIDEMTGERQIEISHEAVITGWVRCARWVDEDRAGLEIHRRLAWAAQQWNRVDRSTDALYRGILLKEALEWQSRAHGRLNGLERDFLDASTALDRSMPRLRWPRRRPPASSEFEAHLRIQQSQLISEIARLRAQEAELRKNAAQLQALAEFEKRASKLGGVFISYSHDDNDVVDYLATRLENDNINYWRDEKELLVGDVIDKAISKGIQQSRLFLIVLTPSSIQSRWVERELNEAVFEEAEGRKVILPVLAKGLRLADAPARLRHIYSVDIGSSFETGYTQLILSIRGQLSRQLQTPDR